MSQPSSLHLERAIVEDTTRGTFRVSRRVFTEPRILEQERRTLFAHCWLYAAHESELAQPSSFVSRNVGGKPLLLNRDRQGNINAFLNSCRHRGALVCREERGRARNFACPYHGWVYGDEGQLLAQPIDASYTDACKSDPALNLKRVPKMASSSGFIFVNFDAGAEPLENYLAGAADYLKLISQQGPDGMEIVGGTQKYCAHANWKLLQENSVDGYHAESTHSTYLGYIRNREGTVRNNYGQAFGRVRNLGNGHAVSESVNSTPWGRPCARWMPSWGEDVKAELDRNFAEIASRIGEEKATFLCHGDRNMLIFPNLIVNDVSGLTIRVVYPIAPDFFEVNAWALAAKGESARVRDLRLKNYVEFLGPGGLATPDDQEMLELCQRGYAADPEEGWNDLSRGMADEQRGVANKLDEFQLRVFWRRWSELMQRHREEVTS